MNISDMKWLNLETSDSSLSKTIEKSDEIEDNQNNTSNLTRSVHKKDGRLKRSVSKVLNRGLSNMNVLLSPVNSDRAKSPYLTNKKQFGFFLKPWMNLERCKSTDSSHSQRKIDDLMESLRNQVWQRRQNVLAFEKAVNDNDPQILEKNVQTPFNRQNTLLPKSERRIEEILSSDDNFDSHSKNKKYTDSSEDEFSENESKKSSESDGRLRKASLSSSGVRKVVTLEIPLPKLVRGQGSMLLDQPNSETELQEIKSALTTKKRFKKAAFPKNLSYGKALDMSIPLKQLDLNELDDGNTDTKPFELPVRKAFDFKPAKNPKEFALEGKSLLNLTKYSTKGILFDKLHRTRIKIQVLKYDSRSTSSNTKMLKLSSQNLKCR